MLLKIRNKYLVENLLKTLSKGNMGTVVVVAALLYSNIAMAQNASQIDPNAFGYYQDAARFTQQGLIGTARLQGMGGASSALGGDITSLSTNPAGLGFYKRNEFNATLGLGFNSSSSTTNLSTIKDNGASFNIGNIGAVFNYTKDDIEPGLFRGGSFAIGMMRTNDFNSNITYQSKNPYYTNLLPGGGSTSGDYSIVNYYLDAANGAKAGLLGLGNDARSPNQNVVKQGYTAYLLDTAGRGGNFGSNIPIASVNQQIQLITSGNQMQFDAGYGANLGDVLFLGAGMGIASLSYQETRKYRESVYDIKSTNADDQTFKGTQYALDYTQSITGTGVNFRLGAIYKPIPAFRAGASIQTPTYYSLYQSSNSNLVATYPNSRYYPNPSINKYFVLDQPQSFNYSNSTFNYTLITPLKASLGLAYFFGENGFITADADVLNYANATVKADSYSLLGDQNTINNIYQTTYNVRLGGEYRKDIFRLRAGYAFYGNPYKNTSGVPVVINSGATYLTAGAGLKFENFYLDLAIINRSAQGTDLFTQYNPRANVKTSSITSVLTVGFNF